MCSSDLYEVPLLEHKLEEFLGFRRSHRAVVVGAGSLGKALMQDSGLSRYGLNIVAAFDTDPALAGMSYGGIPVYPVGEMTARVKEAGATVGIITVPVEHAQSTADALVEAGVKALWNFTPFRLSANDGVIISNTSIYAHLAVMYNRMESGK